MQRHFNLDPGTSVRHFSCRVVTVYYSTREFPTFLNISINMINIATFLFSFKKIALFITVVDLFSKCIYQKTGVINFQPYYVTSMFITFPPIVHFFKWTYKFCDTLEKKLSDSRHFKLDTSHVIRHFKLLDPPILVLFLLQFNCPYGRHLVGGGGLRKMSTNVYIGGGG